MKRHFLKRCAGLGSSEKTPIVELLLESELSSFSRRCESSSPAGLPPLALPPGRATYFACRQKRRTSKLKRLKCLLIPFAFVLSLWGQNPRHVISQHPRLMI